MISRLIVSPWPRKYRYDLEGRDMPAPVCDDRISEDV